MHTLRRLDKKNEHTAAAEGRPGIKDLRNAATLAGLTGLMRDAVASEGLVHMMDNHRAAYAVVAVPSERVN